MKRRWPSSPWGGKPANSPFPPADLNASYHCLLADAFARMGYALRAAMHYEIAGDLDPYDREYVERMRKRQAACGTRLRREDLGLSPFED